MRENEIFEKIEKNLEESTRFLAIKELLKKEISDEFLYLHCLRVGLILSEWGQDMNLVLAGFLHHLPETILKENFKDDQEILFFLKKFNQLEEICSIGPKLKLRKIKEWRSFLLDQRMENLRRMLFIIAGDLGPLFLLLANRLDEARNLSFFSKEQRISKSLEIMEIFVPLAYGLGMDRIKGELEDIAFFWLYPKEYNWLVQNVSEKYKKREEYLKKIKPLIYQTLKEEGINVVQIAFRVKTYFSLYQNLLRKNIDPDDIYDLVALRIIVNDVQDCYKALGVLHKKWPPIENLINDYIVKPKASGYQALHTTVKCEEGKIIEIQIKTFQMHYEAEYGAGMISHFTFYKQKINPRIYYRRNLAWIEETKKKIKEAKNPQEISHYFSSELFPDRIFVLTPKNDVISLPKGATPIDFAYAIHSAVGDYCAGAKVDGKLVSLKTALQTGQRVEILLDKNKTPSYDWLKIVKTKRAYLKIREFLEKLYGTAPSRKISQKPKTSIIRKILPRPLKGPTVLIGGQKGISFRLSKCCQPKPGDPISAFITKEYQVSVHKNNCSNLQELAQRWPQKIIPASWQN